MLEEGGGGNLTTPLFPSSTEGVILIIIIGYVSYIHSLSIVLSLKIPINLNPFSLTVFTSLHKRDWEED